MHAKDARKASEGIRSGGWRDSHLPAQLAGRSYVRVFSGRILPDKRQLSEFVFG
jgi:hypothetical protein